MIRRILLAAALATTSITPVLALSAPAQAAGGGGLCGYSYSCMTYYYYDAGHTMQSGWWKDECGGIDLVYGDTNTPYSTTTITGYCVGGGGGQ